MLFYYPSQVDIDLIDPDGVFQLKPANGTNAIMADDEEEGKCKHVEQT